MRWTRCCSVSATPTARRRRSVASPRSTRGSRSRCRDFSWTGAAAQVFRPSWLAPCRCRRVPPIWCWREGGGSIRLEDRLARPRVTAGGVNHTVPGGMIETAENLRKQYGISRTEQDEFSLRSHGRAVAAQQNGTFAEEIVPVRVQVRGSEQIVERDE